MTSNETGPFQLLKVGLGTVAPLGAVLPSFTATDLTYMYQVPAEEGPVLSVKGLDAPYASGVNELLGADVVDCHHIW